jgi:hypothetical protein
VNGSARRTILGTMAGLLGFACGGPPEEFGAPCDHPRDCARSVCRAVAPSGADLALLELSCGPPGGDAELGAACASQDQCRQGFCSLAGACVAPCAGPDDCSSGARCRTVWARTGPDALQLHAACVPRTRVPDAVRVRPVSAPPLEGGASTRLAVQSRAVALTAFFEVDFPADQAIRIDAVRGGTGPRIQTLFSSEAVLRGESPRSAANLGGNPASWRFPNGDGATDEERFELVLSAGRPDLWTDQRVESLDVLVLERDAFGSRLELDVFDVDAGLDEPTAPRIDVALNFAEDLLGPDLRFGRIRRFQVVGATAERLGVVDLPVSQRRDESDAIEEGELRQLFRLGAGGDRPALPVFLVRDLGPALGISGGIPGTAALPGTGDSGIAVSVGAVDDAVRSGLIDGADAERLLGVILAHEIGHHLGLFHTTEPNGISLDALDDTPFCVPDPYDADQNGRLSPEECAGAGADNLMFYNPPLRDPARIRLTPGQRAVLQQSMLLH